MIGRFIAIALVLFSGCALSATGLEAWREFDVRIESMPGPVHVNGLAMVVHRAVGSGVAPLWTRLSQQWVREVGTQGVRSDVSGDWAILSRIQDGALEVLQKRGVGSNAELLWSRSDLRKPMQPQLPVDLRLPSGCIAGRTVNGRAETGSYVQQVASCTGSPHAALSAMKTRAIRRGYAVQSRDGILMARNSSTEVMVLAWRPEGGAASGGASMVYLQLKRNGRGQ